MDTPYHKNSNNYYYYDSMSLVVLELAELKVEPRKQLL